jgi:sigma-B regulation protein RsbU (phosphoserine phosphatase)
MKPDAGRGSRPTIAFLTRTFRGYLESFPLWHGISDEARESDVNLIYVPGNPPASVFGEEARSNVLYDLVSGRRIDGVIFWTGVLLGHSPPDTMDAFFRRFAGLPRIGIGPPTEGMTNFTVDNYRGMFEACSHLIERHGCRRIAFVRGPALSEEAVLRYRAYRDALEQFGIPLDPALTVAGDFQRESGRKAVAALCDERRASFDAVAAANDATAFGVVDELRARARAVPDEVKVVGFDDILDSRYARIPLATVSQPFYDMGRRAVKKMIKLIAGEEGNETIHVPARFVARLSCGCHGRTASRPALNAAGRTPAREGLAAAVVAATENEPFRAVVRAPAIERIASAFLAEAGGAAEGTFPNAVNRELLSFETEGEVAAFYDLLAALREAVHGAAGEKVSDLLRAETLIQQGLIAVGDFALRLIAEQGFRRDVMNSLLRYFTQQLLSQYTLNDLLQVLAYRLPLLGIAGCWLSLYDDPAGSRETARLVLAVEEGRTIELDPDGRPFPAVEIIPERLIPRSRRFVLFVDAVFSEREPIGFIVLADGPRDPGLYDAVQVQLSVALQSIRHARALEEATEDLERSNRELERFAFVASHHLQEPLRKLSLFADRLDSVCPTDAGSQAREYVAHIRNGARRMNALINDLIAYSKIGAAPPPVAVDLDALFREIREDLAVRLEREGARLETGHLPAVAGVQGQLYLLFTHLVENAINFRHSERPPVVTVNAAAATYRDRPAAEITVTDNGIGIEPRYFDKIFQVFQRLDQKPARGEGTGIGLTLCRKIAIEHGGDIRVESVPGEGSRFIVTLPLAQTAVRAK